MKEKKINKSKIIALIMLMILMLEVLSPFGLLTNVSNAASTPQQPAVVIRRTTDIEPSAGGKWFQVQFAFVGDFYPYMFDLKLKYDASKIEPANKSTKKPATKLTQAVNLESGYSTTFMTSTSYLDTKANTFRLIPNTGEPENPMDYGADANGIYQGYMLIYTMTFRLTDDTLTEDDLTSDLLTLSPTAETAGFKFGWDEDEQQGNPTPKYATDASYLKLEGFVDESSKVVDSITIKTNPNNTTYEHGDAINLEGGEITVSYADGKREDISMTDPKVSIVSGTEANVNRPQVTISYGGKELSFPITVKDPVNSLTVKRPMSNIEYIHGADLDFTDLQLEVTKKSGAKLTLTKESEGVTVSEETANINSENFTKTSGDGVVPVSGKQEIIFNYEGKQVKQTVIVNDTIDGIELIKQPSKTIYKRGETLDLSGAVVKVNLGSGNTTNVNLPDGSITVEDYNNTTVGMKQQLSVSLGKKTATKTIDVEFYNYVKASSIIEPSNTNLTYDTDLNLAGGKLTLIWHDNKTTDIQLIEPSVSIKGYDKKTIGTQTVTVEYPVTYTLSDGTTISDKVTESFVVEVENPIKTISITAPEKTEYKHGEELATNGTITVTFSNDKIENRRMTADMIFENDGTTAASTTMSSYDSTNKANKTLKITYTEDEKTETIAYPITIINTVTGITLQENAKKQYNVNEGLQNGLSIFVAREVGLPEGIEITDEMISGFDTSTEGTRTAKITYTENGITKTADYTYTVTDTVKSISMGTPPKEAQKYGEELNLEGATIQVVKGSKTETIPLESTMIKAGTYDKEKLGEQTVTVEYGTDAEGNPVTTTFKIVVKDYVTGISIHPNSIIGKYNDELSKLLTDNHVKYTVTYAKEGAKTAVDVTENMVEGYDKQVTEEQNLTVTYTDEDENSYTKGEDKTATLTIHLRNIVKSIAITAPEKTEYKHGEELATNGTITVTFSNDKIENRRMTADMIFENDGTTAASTTMSSYDSTNKANKTLKITYTEDEKTETIAYPITIINTVTGITLQENAKKQYNVNEGLQNGLSIFVAREVGLPEGIEITDEMISGFDTSTEGTRTAKITYTENGITKTADYTYTVTDTVKSISMGTPPKEAQKYGEELNLEGATIQVVKGSKTETIPLESTMIKAGTYDKEKLGEQTVTVEYGTDAEGNPVTTTFKIVVKDYVTGISIHPNSIIGKYNDELSKLLTDNHVKYTVTYAKEGAKTAVDVTENMVEGYDKQVTEEQNLTVTYTDEDENSYTKGEDKTETLNVTLIDEVSSLEIENTPKTNYKYGESLDVSNGTLKVIRTSGEASIPIKPDMVTEIDGKPFNGKRLGTRNLNVTYGGITKTYEITVSDYVKGVILTPPTKVKYEYGESLNLEGGRIQKVMASETATTPVSLSDSSVTLSTFNPNKEGAQTITVTYEGFTEKFGVIVEDNIQSITLQEPTKKQYRYGESLNVVGGKITATRTSGKTETINITTSMVTGYKPNQLGNQTLTVTYKGKTATYSIHVEDYVKDMELVKPNKLIYKIGESIDLTGGQVKTIMASGVATSPVAMTNANVKIVGFDSNSEGAKLIKVTYQGITKTFGITVIDKLSDMRLKTLPNKLDYRYGESLDVTGGTIEIEKESGAKEIIKMTKDMVLGYNSKKIGAQTLIVSYQGLKQQFIVNVEDYVSKLKVQVPSKIEYEYGEYLDLTEGKVSIIMASGKIEETVEMTASMVSGFNAKQEGKQTIKVDYKGLQGSFQVNVVDRVKGISVNTKPNKVIYHYSEKLDVTGATIHVVKSSGIYTIPVTQNMISGYDANTPGTQIITITYGGFTTKFIVKVNEPEVTEKPEIPAKQPEKSDNNTSEKPEKVVPNRKVNLSTQKTRKESMTTEQIAQEKQDNTITETSFIQETKEESQEKARERATEEKSTEKSTQEKSNEKPTETLGVKDKKIKDSRRKKVIQAIIGGIELLMLLILIFFRRNVKIYVEENGELVLGGLDKLTPRHLKLNIDSYLDGETYENKVKIRLSDFISRRLDGKTIQIKHRGKVITRKIKYKKQPFEIILK